MTFGSRLGPGTQPGLRSAKIARKMGSAEYFQQADTCYTKPDDIVRVVLEESDALLKLNKPDRALDLVSKTLRNFPNSSAAPLLKNIEREAIIHPSVTPTPKP